jgi:hypothetical protein
VNRDLGIALPPTSDTPSGWSEKRRHPRRALAVHCWIRDDRHTVYARLHDVSLGGLSIRAPILFRPDAELELAIVLASDDEPTAMSAVAVRARGRVVWVRAAAEGPGTARMGAQFVEILEGEAALRRLVGA